MAGGKPGCGPIHCATNHPPPPPPNTHTHPSNVFNMSVLIGGRAGRSSRAVARHGAGLLRAPVGPRVSWRGRGWRWGWGALCELFVRPKQAAAGGLCCSTVVLNGGRWRREAPLPLKGAGWWRCVCVWGGGYAGSERPVCSLLAPSMGRPHVRPRSPALVTTETAGRRIPPGGPEGAGGTVR